MKKQSKFIRKISGFFKKISAPFIKLWDKVTKWTIYKLISDTFGQFGEHRVMKMSAALSYYTIFSLPAMLVIVISICSLVFGQEIVQGKVFRVMNDYVGDQTAMQLQSMLKQTVLKKTNVWATIIGGVTLILSASGIFGEIQDSLNYMWGVKAKPKKGWIVLLLNRLSSFSMLLVLAFILLVSLVLTTALDAFLNFLASHFSQTVIKIFRYVDYGVIWLTVSALFMFIFKVLPDGKVRWKDAFIGAMVTGGLFMVGKFLISLYVSHTNLSAYGGTASLAILLIWVYYSAIIMYIGAEFTQVFAAFKGRRIEPKRFAVRVITEEHEKSSPGYKQAS